MVLRRGADDHQVHLALPGAQRELDLLVEALGHGAVPGHPVAQHDEPEAQPGVGCVVVAAQAHVDVPHARVGLEADDREAVVGRREPVEHAVVPGVALDGLDGGGPVREQDGVEGVDSGGDRGAVREVPRDGAQRVLGDPPVEVRLPEAGEPLVGAQRVLALLRLAPHGPEQLLAVALRQVLQQQPAAVAQPRARPVQLRAAHHVGRIPDPARRGHGRQVGGAGGPERGGVVGREPAAGGVEGRRSPAPPRRSRGRAPTTGRTPSPPPARARRWRVPSRTRAPARSGTATSTRSRPTPSVTDAGGAAHGLGEPAAPRGRRRRSSAHRGRRTRSRRRRRRSCAERSRRPRRPREVVHVERVQRVELGDGPRRVEPQLGGRRRGVRARPVSPREDDVLPLADVSTLPRLGPRGRDHDGLVGAEVPQGSADADAGQEGDQDHDGDDPAASASPHPCSSPRRDARRARTRGLGPAARPPHCRRPPRSSQLGAEVPNG